MNLTYDAEIKKQIQFYEIHPEYMPFVGDRYDDFKILQVGESHFIEQGKEENDFSIEYFKKHWWNEAMPADWDGNCNTRTVVNNYLAVRRTRAHGIFTNMVKLYSRVYTDTPITSISTENSQAYHHFAFMNFYQMPSLYRGMSYWDSLLKSAKKVYDEKLVEKYACEVWEDTVKRSTETLNQVIEILDPQVIIFTSESAYKAYNRQQGNHIERKGVFHCVHPGCKYWHHPSEGQIGKNELEQELRDFLNK